MRVPKFRAWDEEFQTMYEVKSIIYTLGSMLCVNREALFPERTLYFEDTPIMQFTGLFDVNDKEIFEGDIVKATWGFSGVVDYDDFIYYKVERAIDDDIEIIGNIHDNPELITNPK